MHFFQYRDEASSVHYNTVTLVMILTGTMVDKNNAFDKINVNTVSRLHYLQWLQYEWINEWLCNVYDLYYNKLVQVVSIICKDN
jgi:hypothetical protein